MVAWFVLLLIAVVFEAVSYILMPKPPQERNTAQDLENPVAEAGKPVGVVQGTVTVSGLNVLWYGEKSINTYKINA